MFEVLSIKPSLRRAIKDGLGQERLRDVIEKEDFVSIAENCRRLVIEGVTTVSEAFKTINSSDL